MSKRFVIVLFLLTLFTLLCTIQSSNILVWVPISSRSIRLSMAPFIEALADKGHNVTCITIMDESDKDFYKESKINIFVPKKWAEAMVPWENEEWNFYNIRQTFYGVPKSWYDIRPIGIHACEMLYTDPMFLTWVKASPNYDIVVVEATMMNECAYGLVHLWNSKLIIYSTTSVLPGFPDAFGLPDESSSISDITFGFPGGNKMSYFQRFVNALSPIVYSLTKKYFYLPKMEEITRNGWQAMGISDEVPAFGEVEKNASLVLLTTHFSLDYPRSFPPNVVPVGGVVVTKKMKPLSEEMEKYLNSAKNGFIYINFGTLTQLGNFDESAQIAFVNALRQFPSIHFVWSSPASINKPLPDNVFVTPWVPQQTILAHPNIKAFITHSGMGAITEAIHFSVPMICIPILADQDHNAQVIVSRNAGIKLEIVGLEQEQLQNAISEIINNEKYRTAMNQLTKVFMDRPTPPLENAIWWIEYVLRHENINQFLVSPSATQPWWKRRQIDIWLTCTLLLIGVVFILMCFIYSLIRKILPKHSSLERISKERPKLKVK